MNDKYVVFKKEEYLRWWDDASERERHDAPNPLDDAVVIRRQDMFAPPALDAYANSILIAAQLFDGYEASMMDVDASDIAKRLREVADYFHEQAVLSWDTERKFPD